MLYPQATPYVKGGNSKTLLRFLSLNTVFDLNFFQAEGIQCSGMLAPLFSGDVTLSSPHDSPAPDDKGDKSDLTELGG